jgi:hypothetical protein
LSGKKEVLVVVEQVLFLFDVLGPLEEEDKAVDLGFDPIDEIIVF